MTAMNALSASLRFQGMLASCLCSEGIEPALLVNVQCQGVIHSEGIEPELLLSIQCQGVFHDAGRARMSNPMSTRITHRRPHRNEAM